MKTLKQQYILMHMLEFVLKGHGNSSGGIVGKFRFKKG